MERSDIAIIGTGPAGVSAALTAKNRNKSILLLGRKELSGKVQKSHKILNYPGLPDIAGEELARAMREHLEKMDIAVTEEQVTNVYAMGDYFAVQCAKNMYEARTVIIATGVMPGKPLPGEEENLGRGVSYCATCDAALYKGKEAAVIGYSPKEEEEAKLLAEFADRLDAATINTIESGYMTKDLAGITELKDVHALNTEEFIKAIAERL